jgi:hypothetical protein
MRMALGAGALFLGGVSGGVLGSALFRTPEERSTVAPMESIAAPRDDGLRAAIEALAAELRRANLAAPVDDGLRVPADGGGGAPTPTAEFAALTAALERLTQALGQARGTVAGGGIGVTPLVLPPPGHHAANLSALLAMDPEEASRQFRLWTYQQVVDHFGRPDQVYEGGWAYELPEPGDRREFTFRFIDGFLSRIDY